MQQRSGISGEVWGGVSAMLVALPSAIAFGVTIFAPLGGSYAARGAVAGILGATAIGLVAPALGGTNRLISAPCAPAAAVLSAVAIDLTQRGIPAGNAMLLIGVIALLTGLLQIAFGLGRLGRLIKYMPYPVVSGYLSGVGLLIILSQLPKVLGVAPGVHVWHAIIAPGTWQWHTIVVGTVTIGAMLAAPRITRAIPATIIGLVAGIATYFALALADRSLLTLAGNANIVGPIAQGGGVLAGMTERFSAARAFSAADLAAIVAPAMSLAVLLSIDTLKTCVVIDALTRSRHDSDRELIAQGCANVASTIVGGVPGAGTMGATLVNISSGARTRLSGVIEGGAALLAFVALGSVLAWIPLAALAGVLIVVGVRMFDRHSLQLIASPATRLDFAVIVAVVIVAETVSLIAASGVGIALAILLFIREQAHTTIVWRRMLGNQLYSKQVRAPAEMAVLQHEGVNTVILELQGSLFFGTADRLYSEIAPELSARRFVILDFGRVQSVDVTAVHVLEQLEDTLREKGGALLLTRIARRLPNGTDLSALLAQTGLLDTGRARAFDELDAALEWTENDALSTSNVRRDDEVLLQFQDLSLFRGRKPETFAALEACTEQRRFAAGERIFSAGDTGDALYLVRRGAVRIELPILPNRSHHVATFARGDFFGEMAFLDHEPRSAHAIAERDTDLYVLSRSLFDAFAEQHHRLAQNLVEGLAHTLAVRLRQTNVEVRALEDG